MTHVAAADAVRIPGRSVVLRDWEIADLDQLRHWLQPWHAWHRLDGPYYAPPDPDAVVERLRTKIEGAALPFPREGLAIAAGATDSLLGSVSRVWESRETNWLTVGVAIYDDREWRKGFGYESLGLWSDHLFAEMAELARLDLRTWSGNTGMVRLAEKLGYRREACFRNARVVGGRFYDGLGYGVLRDEWAERYPHGFATCLTGE